MAERQVEVDGYNKELKDVEAAILSARTTIAECEHKMTAKQTEAMYHRDLANSDVRSRFVSRFGSVGRVCVLGHM